MNLQYKEEIFVAFFDPTDFLLIFGLLDHQSEHSNFATYANFEPKNKKCELGGDFDNSPLSR